MYYKNYGNTGLKVSAIGMGAMRFDSEDVKAGRFEKCAEVVLYAHEKGINYFDTAPFYCSDKSETITGLGLSQLKRDSYYVSSKTNLGTVDNTPDEEHFRRRLETTLTRLKVDYLDFYHLWCMLDWESFQKQKDALYKFFEKAKSEGLIRHIVFSSHMDGSELEQVIDTNLFDGMLIGYNALNYRFRQSGIEAAYNKGMGVVVMNPLGGGLIPNNPDTFKYLAEGSDLSVPQAAARFVASHKEITVTLVGFATKEHIDDACHAVENLQEENARDIVCRHEDFGISLNNLCTGCGYCKDCPQDIEIPKYMDAYNLKLLGGSIQQRLSVHWNITKDNAGKCVNCGNCEHLCTQHLPIMERLDEIAAL